MSRSTIISFVSMALIILLIFSPDAKAIVIQGLMKVGLFRAPTEDNFENKKGVEDTVAAPGMILKSSRGATINIIDQKGKVLFINFWATWCPPCIAEMPSINTLYEKFKTDPKVMIIEIDVDGKFSKSDRFMKKNKFDLPVYNLMSDIPEGFYSGASQRHLS